MMAGGKEIMAPGIARQTALLVLHVQQPITEMVEASLIDRIARAIVGARGTGLPIIYAYTGFRSGYPEIPPNAPFRHLIVDNSLFIDGIANAAHPKVAPQKGDPMIRTPRVGAFTGTDLEIILRAKDIKHLVLAGISTGGVVLSTVIHALERDYQVTVLSDGCADPDEEKHRVLLKSFVAGAPWFANAVTIDEWLESL
jgi:nicotinamidase-related amidase